MDPMFNLPQAPAPIFGRTTNFEYKKVMSDPTFNPYAPAGRWVFRWQNQAGEWWVPSQSYLRLRLGFLAKDAGSESFRPFVPADGVAPVMNLPPHLFSRLEYFMDNNKLSDLQDFIPQIDTMKNRMTKSSKWFETVGHRSAFWDPDFATRQAQVCADFVSGASGIVSDGRIASERAVVLDGRPVSYSGELLPETFFSDSMISKTYEFYRDFNAVVVNGNVVAAVDAKFAEAVSDTLSPSEQAAAAVLVRTRAAIDMVGAVISYYKSGLEDLARLYTGREDKEQTTPAYSLLSVVPIFIAQHPIPTLTEGTASALLAWLSAFAAWVVVLKAFKATILTSSQENGEDEEKAAKRRLVERLVPADDEERNPWTMFHKNFPDLVEAYRAATGNAVNPLTEEVEGALTLLALIQGGTTHDPDQAGSSLFNAEAEGHIKPQWCTMNVGSYTYYCVATGLSKPVVKAISKSLTQSGYGDHDKLDGESLLEERATQIYNLMSIFKRYHFLTGSKQQAYKSLATLLSLPAGFERNLTQLLATRDTVKEAFTSLGYLPEVDNALTGSSWIGAGMANITETVHGDGIDVLLEQEFKDGKVTSSKAKWLPKLDMFVVDNSTGPDKTLASNYFNTYLSPSDNKAESSVIGSFSLLDTIFSKEYAESDGKSYTYSTPSDSSLFESRLGLTSIIKNIKSVIVRPPKPSKDVLPASRHELIWKPTLGVFDVPHNIPSTVHELHCVIPADYQLRALDFARQNLDAAGISAKILDPRVAQGSQKNSESFTKYFLKIESIEFFAGMAMGPRADDAKFVLDLREYRMIPYSIPTSQTNRGHTYPFNLSASTASVTVAFQSAKAGNGSSALSKFVVPTKVSSRGAETALDRFYVNFANQNRPREENESVLSYRGHSSSKLEASALHSDVSTQFFTQRYQETMLNTGQFGRAGGCETFEEWLDRGAYYNWVWPRDGADLSTRFHVFVQFRSDKQDDTKDRYQQMSYRLLTRDWPETIGSVSNDVNILVFDMVPKAYSLSITNGRVTGAETSAVMAGDGVRRPRLA